MDSKDKINIDIIYEDENLLVLKKPRGMSSQPDKRGDLDILTFAEENITKKSGGLFIINRLDRPVGGIIIFSKTQEYAKFITTQLVNKKICKKYLGIVEGNPKNEDTLENYLIKNQRLNISKVVNPNKNAKLSLLTYKKLITLDKLSLLDISPKTGRHHQIRVQLSHAGLPLFGDSKYNPNFRHKIENIGLWAYYYGFYDEKRKKHMEFVSLPTNEKNFSEFSEAFPQSLSNVSLLENFCENF